MQTFILSDHEYGTVTTNRSSSFKPIEGYQSFLDEFESCYDIPSLSNFTKLFSVVFKTEEEIILVVNDCIMTNAFRDDDDLEGMRSLMKENGNSEQMIKFMENHFEELYASDIIEFIALPGQNINVQITDLEFGNTELTVTT